MSATKITSSKTKLALWQRTRDLDQKAKQIAERDGIALIEAYGRAACDRYPKEATEN